MSRQSQPYNSFLQVVFQKRSSSIPVYFVDENNFGVASDDVKIIRFRDTQYYASRINDSIVYPVYYDQSIQAHVDHQGNRLEVVVQAVSGNATIGTQTISDTVEVGVQQGAFVDPKILQLQYRNRGKLSSPNAAFLINNEKHVRPFESARKLPSIPTLEAANPIKALQVLQLEPANKIRASVLVAEQKTKKRKHEKPLGIKRNIERDALVLLEDTKKSSIHFLSLLLMSIWFFWRDNVMPVTHVFLLACDIVGRFTLENVPKVNQKLQGCKNTIYFFAKELIDADSFRRNMIYIEFYKVYVLRGNEKSFIDNIVADEAKLKTMKFLYQKLFYHLDQYVEMHLEDHHAHIVFFSVCYEVLQKAIAVGRLISNNPLNVYFDFKVFQNQLVDFLYKNQKNVFPEFSIIKLLSDFYVKILILRACALSEKHTINLTIKLDIFAESIELMLLSMSRVIISDNQTTKEKLFAHDCVKEKIKQFSEDYYEITRMPELKSVIKQFDEKMKAFDFISMKTLGVDFTNIEEHFSSVRRSNILVR